MKARITIEVELFEPKEWQKDLTPAQLWLQIYDLQCEVDDGHIKVISEEVLP